MSWNIYNGENQVKKIYKGNNNVPQIYEKESPLYQENNVIVNFNLVDSSFVFSQTSVGSNNPWNRGVDNYGACSYPQTVTNLLHINLKKSNDVPDNAIINKIILTMSRTRSSWGPVTKDVIIRLDKGAVNGNNLALTSVGYPVTPSTVTNDYGGDTSLWGLGNLRNSDLGNINLTIQTGGGSNSCQQIINPKLTIEFKI